MGGAARCAEREAQLAEVAAEAACYWALYSPMGHRPKWQLRPGHKLSEDATANIGAGELAVPEPLLLYRGFKVFRGDALQAQQYVSACERRDTMAMLKMGDWLDAERARLGPGDETRSSRPPCIECGQRPCACHVMDDPFGTTPTAVARRTAVSRGWKSGCSSTQLAHRLQRCLTTTRSCSESVCLKSTGGSRGSTASHGMT